MTKTDYWAECLADSFGEHGVIATSEQIQAVARDVEISRDNMSMAFYVPENPLIGDLKRAEAALKAETALVFCVECQGSGRLQYNSGPWAVNTQCNKCHGNGKHKP
jgi:hypothetical protein